MNDKVMARTSLFRPSARPPADIRQSNNQFFPSENLVNKMGTVDMTSRYVYAYVRNADVPYTCDAEMLFGYAGIKSPRIASP
ncbi:hypothetical protein DPMN_097408 [Dreissena polymorpha]|uniref:Uncharacterized protein n=1 Tax=Dreissena polymorpha TaxID=45954 RepID=A0A9D4R6C4_DREPO|nr:hypothetical protein DPMN_097408 [Dreissena polymorpha]